MCGFLAYREQGNNTFIRKRGPDHTGTLERDGLHFIHNLLSVTGSFSPQPFVDGDIVCLYNGEIYNHRFEKSDGENLIPLYRAHGLMLPWALDGEFAIALYDFGKDLAVFITDRFATKPLWRNGIECASYRSGVGGTEMPPNTLEAVKISTGELVYRTNYHRWDFNQVFDTYDRWLQAFEDAIRKRAAGRCFLGLSSGYDSGAISRELTRQNVDFKAFSVLNNENRSIIEERAKYCYEWEEVKISDGLLDDVEDIAYAVAGEGTVKNDIASLGLAAICKRAVREGRKVYLSGQGADEIIGDYKLYPKQSNFKGVFPAKLEKWENFDSGFQRDYIHKEEHVAGAYGVETRYPFLDTHVVQEFLWLKPELKNSRYKAPVAEYLDKYHVPYEKDVKRGFRPV